MLMSDLAVRELESKRDTVLGQCRRLLLSLFGRTSDHRLPAPVMPGRAPGLQAVPAGQLRRQTAGIPSAATGQARDKRWQRHPQLRAQQPAHAGAAAGQRSARLEAERGMILARGGKLTDAMEAFITAATDPAIDLSTLPGFWDLPRNAMLTAVRAYEHTHRFRDAAALEARVRHLLKPRALKPVSQPHTRTG